MTVGIELVPLGTMTVELRTPFALTGTPAGNRMIFEVESGTISGERFNAKLKGQAAADWLTVGPDGTGTLDVRALVETDDGALVFIQYNGRLDMADTRRPCTRRPASRRATSATCGSTRSRPSPRAAWPRRHHPHLRALRGPLTLNGAS